MEFKVQTITSRDNRQFKAIRRLAQSSSAFKAEGLVWLEGEHLCDAYLKSDAFLKSKAQIALQTAVLSQSQSQQWLQRINGKVEQVMVLPDSLFDQLSSLPSSGGLGFVLQHAPQKNEIQKTEHTLVLDRVQDAGNVGSMLRSAAAFGVTQVLALEGTALLWSPKVLRAAMGAHFALHIVEGLIEADIELDVPMLATDVHGGAFLHELQATQKIPHPCAWIMGHEGQGVSQALLHRASTRVNIAQVGQESLNVAAAAAVCLYASTRHTR